MIQVNELIVTLRKLSVDEIAKLMSISENLAKLNYERYQNFDVNFSNSRALRPAIFAFQGDAYKEFAAETLPEQDIEFCQNNIQIISGLYGLISSLDLVQPYRLEMKTALITAKHKNLYQFWGAQISQQLNKQLVKHDNKTIINLASSEYSKAICRTTLLHNMIDIDFKESSNNNYRTIGIYAKKARGAMARFIVDNKIEQPQELKKFNLSGYSYNTALSNANSFIFTREKPCTTK